MQKFPLKFNNDDIFYFLHIPKTAGTSFIHATNKFFYPYQILPESLWVKLLQLMPKDFTKFRLIRGHFGYGLYRILPKKPIYLTMLRDPLERTLSWHGHLQKQLEPRDSLLKKLNESETLFEVLEDPEINGSYINFQVRHIGLDLDIINETKNFSTKEKSRFFFNLSHLMTKPTISDKEIFNDAIKHLSDFEFIGLTEKFEESMMLLCYTFGWKPLVSSFTKNISSKRMAKEELSSKVIDKILDCNKFDIELYNIGIKIFETRFNSMKSNLESQFGGQITDDLPNKERLYQLLQLNWKKNGQNIRIPSNNIDFDFGQKLLGNGWYGKEFSKKYNKPFRWSGPSNVSIIKFPLKKVKDLEISIDIVQYANKNILKSLQLFVNGRNIPLSITFLEGQQVNLKGLIPKLALNNFKEFSNLTFKIKSPERKLSLSGKSLDFRNVGLAFHRIKFVPK